ncbi:YbfB/YjiJ family MFS transporter [Klebsiella pneumoniae]|nr:YbfB/YjiJ family MFS transporter [Klebsiella pneumoniae]MCS5987192.1 YbfB/YjiJ family MFS transporter [Klebsiella pneumoniae subsp. pneumoniae]APM43915.1 MFS transporter [Klebsiella pneumoniae]EKW5385687.1 YbfB/YjiJ family MFS transporter [Klebsiella pneumoniae]MBE9278201.1 YbfB/YjiJ family MFS transporter [Klebsiella pneumoniae]MBF8055501.1 YbfB/YjiJ family MFS transporter [Klebsiella pneumoniae]
MNNQSRQALWLALAGSIVLMIGMGYGRFAFTGVLPLMLNEGLLTLHEGNLAASANYAGYLVGALLLARVQPGAATRLSIISAGLTIASLALLAWVSSPWIIITLRAVAGALSAITLIAGSLWLLEHMGHHHGAPLLYAGVGLGIFISAEGIALGHALNLTSQQIWLLCALCAGLLLALAIRWLLTPPAALVRVSHVETSSPASGSDTRRAAWRLLMVYGLAGFGYIITATYLPLFLSGSLQSVDPVHLWALFGLAGFGYIITATYLPLFLSGSLQSVDPVHLWALFGLAAAPSCLIWHKLVLKWGYRQALTRNLLVQALGVILPACSASLLFCVLSALLVGFTFMGTVTIALPKAKSLSHQVSFNMIAAMTALYGVGQIAGPLIAGALYQIAASFNPALYAAALALLIAAGLVFTERQA